ncbi:MAG: transcription antitermination factor NusB, partial [Moraxellaceae bacterium]|nr:transcription antitermination factor NusB [Moraxellaceae bacterium]
MNTPARGNRPRQRSARALAAEALAPVLAGRGSLSDSLPPALAACRAEDRGLLQALVFTTARHALHYRALLKPLLSKAPEPVIEALLLLGLAQLRELRTPDHAALSETVEAARQLGRDKLTGLINAVLRRYQREQGELEKGAAVMAHAHPLWLVQQLRRDWGETGGDALATSPILAANNSEAPLTLRVNTLQGSREDYLAALTASGLAAQACTYAANALTVEGAGDVRLLPGFETGRVSVQDEAAQLAAQLLEAKAGMRVLDACAA